MNNKILDLKKDDLIKNSNAIIDKITELDKEIQKLANEKAQLSRNFDATNGALQLIEILMAEDAKANEQPAELKVVE